MGENFNFSDLPSIKSRVKSTIESVKEEFKNWSKATFQLLELYRDTCTCKSNKGSGNNFNYSTDPEGFLYKELRNLSHVIPSHRTDPKYHVQEPTTNFKIVFTDEHYIFEIKDSYNNRVFFRMFDDFSQLDEGIKHAELLIQVRFLKAIFKDIAEHLTKDYKSTKERFDDYDNLHQWFEQMDNAFKSWAKNEKDKIKKN